MVSQNRTSLPRIHSRKRTPALVRTLWEEGELARPLLLAQIRYAFNLLHR